MSETRYALAKDLPELSRTLASAFSEDPVMAWMLEDPATREEKLTRMMRFGLQTGLVHGHLYTLPGLRAAAVWAPPDVPFFDDVAGAELGRLLAEEIGERAGEKLAALLEMMKAHPEETHFYLYTLGTHAQAQSQGLGAKVIEPVLAFCDAQGLPAFLESSNPRNIPFYERHGFRIVGEIPLAEAGPVVHPMWRDPRG